MYIFKQHMFVVFLLARIKTIQFFTFLDDHMNIFNNEQVVVFM